MPTVSVSTATAANAGLRRSIRAAYRTSCHTVAIVDRREATPGGSRRRTSRDRLRELLAHAPVVTQFVEGRTPRIVGAVAHRAQFLVAVVEMLLEFLRDLRFASGIEVRRPTVAV